MKKHFECIDDFAYQSPLRKCSAVLKFIFTIMILLLCLYLDNMIVSCYIILTMFLINVFKNGIKWQYYVAMLSIPLVFVFFACIAIAIEVKFDKGITIDITMQNVLKSICVMARTFAAVSTLYFLTLSTPVYQIVSVLKKFHVPKILMELMYMTYRYVFLLIDIQYQLKIASMARLGYCDFVTSLKTFGNCIANLFILSLKKAQQQYQAMEARCYSGELLFLQEEQIYDKTQIAKGLLYLFSILLLKIVLRGKTL